MMYEAPLPAGFAVEPITIYWKAPGHYDATTGVWVSGATTTSAMRASVQRANGEDLRNVPELQRADAYYKLYTQTPLATVNESTGLEPYEVQWQGEKWRVVHVDRWEMNTLNHRKILITRETRNQQAGVNP